MSELISGEEAKVAWAEGVTVQVATGADQFRTLVSSDDLGIFDRGNYFRLKLRTITINGISYQNKDEAIIAVEDFFNGNI